MVTLGRSSVPALWRRDSANAGFLPPPESCLLLRGAEAGGDRKGGGQHHGERKRGNKDTLSVINKLCSEIYAQRHLSVATYSLDVTNVEELMFVGWTDAAVGNRPDLSSTGGMAIALVSPRILQGQRSHVNLISWRSGKRPRTARSSLSAEIQALSEGEQELIACRLQWAELLGHQPDLRRPWETV